MNNALLFGACAKQISGSLKLQNYYLQGYDYYSVVQSNSEMFMAQGVLLNLSF